MPYLDLEYKIRTNGEFRHTVRRFSTAMAAAQLAAAKDPSKDAHYKELLNDFLLFCGRNPVMLTPFFFPRYPEGTPLNFQDYPFAWNLFRWEAGSTTTVRGSRQIAKSTALGVRQIMMARLIPSFSTMYLCPTNEQLETYSNRLRDIERAQYDFANRNTDFRSNLRLKEFSNGSKIELVYAHTSATNIRGKSCSDLNLDECMSPLSLLWNGEKFDILVDLKPGDRIVGFDDYNHLKYDRVRRTICKGKRPTWRVNLTNGSFLECTSNERLRTNHGWLYLSQILPHSENIRCRKAVEVEALINERRADGTRNAAGRRLGYVHHDETCALSCATRSDSGRVLSEKGGDSESLHQLSGKDSTELRVGQGELYLFDGDYSCVRLYTLPVLPNVFPEHTRAAASGEVCESGLARSADVGGSCVLVHGRRESGTQRKEQLDSELLHTRLSGTSGSASGSDVDGPRCRSTSTPCEERRQGVLDDSSDCGRNTRLSEAYRTLRRTIDAVQVPVVSEHHALPVLRGYDREHTYRDNGQEVPLLRSAGLQECKAQAGKQGREKQARSPGSHECPDSGDAQRQSEDASRAGQRGSSAQGTESGLQSQMGSPAYGVKAGQLSKPRGSATEGGVRCQILRQEESSLGGVKLELTAIASIEFLGEQEVWDVETEQHHTFFANGVAVHNCQDFDPDLEIEVEMMQSASKIPMTMYTGTSLTTDTFLEAKYLDSSQAVWVLNCGCGHENIPLPEFKVMDMIQPQGPSCVKCGRLLDVTKGVFRHQDMLAFNARRYGYHIPQLIVPAVVKNTLRWDKLYRQKHKGNPSKFLQEILGIPIEEGSRELTLKQLQEMCTLTLGLDQLLQKAQRGGYQWIVSGCDWGGSDYQPMTKSKISTTVHCILGITPDGYMDILHFSRYAGMDYDHIIGDIIGKFFAYKGYAIASDTGVGALYNDKLRFRIPSEKHLMFTYTGPDTMLLAEPSKTHLFNTWMLNKTDSLTLTFDAIRNHRIRCFKWDYASEYLLDCLNMYRAPGEKASGVNTFVYRASASKPNDALQALNYAHMLARIVMGEPMFADQSMKNRVDEILRGNAPYINTGEFGAFSG